MSKSKFHSSVPIHRGELPRGGFSLVEILVAVAILAVILLMVVGMANSTADLTTLSTRRISADAEGQQALDRISSDMSRMILRNDLAATIEKSPGNDAISFYAQAAGYDGDRGISRIGYRVNQGQLQRGAQGSFWNSAANQFQLPFNSSSAPEAIPDADFEIMAADIFRLEVAFLMRDGTIQSEVDTLSGRNPAEGVRAVLVGVVALDSKTRHMMSGSIEGLAAFFPDAANSVEILSVWGPVLDSPEFNSESLDGQYPKAVRAAVQIYQRYIYLE